MAHVMLIKKKGLGPMVGHYARIPESKGFTRPNIDPTRTAENYVIGAESPEDLAREVSGRVREAEARHREVAGRKVRKDATILCDWVVTLPADCPPELAKRFFKSVLRFMQARYGAECCPGAFVHLDESRPHAHIPVVPVLADGRMNATRKIDRRDLQTFHGDLSTYVEKVLGVHVSIQLDPEDRAARALSDVKDKSALTIVSAQAAHDREVTAAARREAARAGREMVDAQDRATRAQRDADKARADAQGARREATRAREDTDRAKADARAARAQADAAREQEAAARAAAREAKAREQAARASEAEAHRAADAAREQAERARDDAKRARREADAAREDAAKARADADRAREELDGLRSQLAAAREQLAAAREELARVRGEIDQVVSRAKARFREWARSLERQPSINEIASRAARDLSDALREAGFGDRDEPCR